MMTYGLRAETPPPPNPLPRGEGERLSPLPSREGVGGGGARNLSLPPALLPSQPA